MNAMFKCLGTFLFDRDLKRGIIVFVSLKVIQGMILDRYSTAVCLGKMDEISKFCDLITVALIEIHSAIQTFWNFNTLSTSSQTYTYKMRTQFSRLFCS